MESMSIILGSTLLFYSLNSSTFLLTRQSRQFQELYNHSKAFDCLHLSELWTGDIESLTENSQIEVNGVRIPCLIPNLYKEQTEEEGRIDRLFDEILAYCRETLCY